LEVIDCLCGSKSNKMQLRGEDNLHKTPGIFTVVKCSKCGLVFTNPRPTPGEMDKLYPDNYLPYVLNPSTQESERNGGNNRLKNIFKTSMTFIPDLPPNSKVLELGCGNGSFLYRLRSRGWMLEGIDFSKKAVRYAQEQLRLNVMQGNLEDFNYRKMEYDCVFAWMVLEHLHHPLDVIHKVSYTLKKGGYFICSIPNYNSFNRILWGKYWHDLDLPRHLYHFDKINIRHILQKEGYTDIVIKHVDDYDSFRKSFFNSIAKLRSIYKIYYYDKSDLLAFRIVRNIVKTVYRVFCRVFRKSGRIIVIAKRI
jgi:SAM-dependent methyltransferase